MFEKLEFYLNLKNDFALTFIQDKHRVYFFSKKNPQNANEAWHVENIQSYQKSYWEREREYKSRSIFFLFPFLFL